ncbi:hypothetical protein B0H16DRAFT_1488069, partial [Mycena metata]
VSRKTFNSTYLLPLLHLRATGLVLSRRRRIHRADVNDVVDHLLELVGLVLHVRALVGFLAMLGLVRLKDATKGPDKLISNFLPNVLEFEIELVPEIGVGVLQVDLALKQIRSMGDSLFEV